jgi:HlyD family secretion protein
MPTATSPPTTANIGQTLGLDPAIAGSRRRRRRLRRGVALAVPILVAGVLLRGRSRDVPVQYQTETTRRETLTVTVTATGSLESLTKVSVGTEISGVVEEVNADYNSPVKMGQVLARINSDKLQAQAEQARASLQSAKAKRLQSEATAAEAEAQLARMEQVRLLSEGKVPSQAEYDTQAASLKRAKADEAAAAAGVMQAEASLAQIEADLRKAVIRSPITGIVLDRAVDRGQTVAAAFQTPTLFTLAEDLTRMKLSVDIDEADIGQVHEGQRATFRVDAFPDRTFPSRVSEVRSTATTSNGVVTYKTILTVDNAERLLKPGMTATATIVVSEVANALLAPNAAFRFTPPAESTRGFSLLPAPPAARTGLSNALPAGHGRLWTLGPGQETPTQVEVTTGPSDGTWTVVISKNLATGTLVVTNAITLQ